MPDCAIIVPARLGSQRFPRKLLEPVAGKPLILHTADNLRRIAGPWPVYFAVAEGELAAVLEASGYPVIQTDPDLPSGTDRIAVANREIGASVVVNVQGDEPVLQAGHLEQVVKILDASADMATLATPFASLEDFRDPHKVKVVCGPDGRALYFSRSPVPFARDSGGGLPSEAYWHLGLYAYRGSLLEAFLKWAPTPLEQIERLEQLRVLERGGCIRVGITRHRTIGVDTAEDLQTFKEHLATKDT